MLSLNKEQLWRFGPVIGQVLGWHAPPPPAASALSPSAHRIIRRFLRNGFTAYAALLCPENLPRCANGRFSPTARRWI
jgi:hypothetical protein